jgi:hypothetical protein
MTTIEPQHRASTTPIPTALSAAPTEPKANLLDVVVNSVFAGMVPWIVHGFLSGPGRFELAAWTCFGLSLTLFLLTNRHAGKRRILPLEVFDIAWFVLLIGIGYVASDAQIDWFEDWSGELSFGALAAFVFIGILRKKPFTLSYAKRKTAPEMWTSPLFIAISTRISLVWGLSFVFGALASLAGYLFNHGGNTFWTGWVLQIAANLFAMAFTEWYPQWKKATVLQRVGKPTEPPASAFALVAWVPGFMAVVGIAGILTDAVPTSTGAWISGISALVWVRMNAEVRRRAEADAARTANAQTPAV